MSEYICLRCTTVSNCINPKCCGETETFDPAKHGRLLIPGNNGWIRVKEAWDKKFRENELIMESSDKLSEDGCSSGPTHMIYGIRALVDFYDENKDL